MKLKTRLMLFTAALALSAGMARAAITGNDVVRSYQEAAYNHIEVKEGPTQIKVEAIKDGVVIEVVYDKVSGEVIKTESRNASADETGRTGVELRTTREDFISDGEDDRDDEDSGDDSGDDSDDDSSDDSDDDSNDNSGDDSGDDDHGGDDDGPDHDSGDDHGDDDHGGGDDDGPDHDSGDDHGGDDHEDGDDD